MRLTLALLVVAGSLAGVLPAAAQDQPTTPPQPTMPTALPVPDGPVVERKELPGGLIVEDLVVGNGYEVKEGGAVVAHYHGTLRSDPTKVFDSSFQRGEPIAFPLNGVIEGWQKGVPGMKIGGVRRLTIPAAMAYGEQSPSEDIPANSDLVFVIRLEDALQTEDITVGSGVEAVEPFVPVTRYVMKNADGNVVDQRDGMNPYVWVPNEFGALSMGLQGMKVGGRRRITIPAEMNFTDPQFGPTWPQETDLVVEVELIAVRNLGMPGRPAHPQDQ